MSENNGFWLFEIVLLFLALLFAIVAAGTEFRSGKPKPSQQKKKPEKPSEPDGIAKRDGALQVLELLTALDELNNS